MSSTRFDREGDLDYVPRLRDSDSDISQSISIHPSTRKPYKGVVTIKKPTEFPTGHSLRGRSTEALLDQAAMARKVREEVLGKKAGTPALAQVIAITPLAAAEAVTDHVPASEVSNEPEVVPKTPEALMQPEQQTLELLEQ